METREIAYKGTTLNGFFMLFLNLALTIAAIVMFVFAVDNESWQLGAGSVVTLLVSLFLWAGFMMLEPGEARVVMFFGKYVGTFTRTGYYWINPFTTTKKLSLRARQPAADPIKVTDRAGNPVPISRVS